MLYCAGGYPGLYFPIASVAHPPSLAMIEIPMLVRTGDTTRALALTDTLDYPMAVTDTIEIPMTRGLADHAPIPMRVAPRAQLAPSVIGADVPLAIVLHATMRPVALARAVTIPMAVVTEGEIPMSRGLVNGAEIPMQIATRATLERT